jgi:hypothetical protein
MTKSGLATTVRPLFFRFLIYGSSQPIFWEATTTNGRIVLSMC